jgi:hypothetical protein
MRSKSSQRSERGRTTFSWAVGEWAVLWPNSQKESPVYSRYNIKKMRSILIDEMQSQQSRRERQQIVRITGRHCFTLY